MNAHLSAHIPTTLGRNSALHLLGVGGSGWGCFRRRGGVSGASSMGWSPKADYRGRHGSGKSVDLLLAYFPMGSHRSSSTAAASRRSTSR